MCSAGLKKQTVVCTQPQGTEQRSHTQQRWVGLVVKTACSKAMQGHRYNKQMRGMCKRKKKRDNVIMQVISTNPGTGSEAVCVCINVMCENGLKSVN